ncbi:nucleoporin [Hysterangium stoloniferum]|nr:nucleoporin [Hysterangium stoloniferum]
MGSFTGGPAVSFTNFPKDNYPTSSTPFQSPSPSKPPGISLATLAKASDVLNSLFEKDAQMVPELRDTLASSSSAAYNIPPHRSWAPFYRPDGVEGFKSMPTGVFDEYDEVRPHCCMGLFPNIQRAWITLNNRLLLWDYTEGSLIATFEVQEDVILHVGLVKARPDVFIDEIKHLLVLSTAKSILLIGVADVPVSGPSPSGDAPRLEVKLYETGFIHAAKEMQSIVGTKDGRIFMCGVEDGYLYELIYQSSEGWFSKKLSLICHSSGGSITSLLPVTLSSWRIVPTTDDRVVSIIVDEERQYLYTLTQRPHISMFSLGLRGDSLLLRSTLKNIIADTNRIVPSDAFTIVGLHVIQKGARANDASDQPQLMAVTSTGARLYFSKQRYMMGMDPDTLQLTHVRLPPQSLRHPPADPVSAARVSSYLPPVTAVNGAPFHVKRIEGSCYASGVTLERQSPGEDPEKSDFIICISPDLATLSSLGSLPTPSYNQYSTYPSSSGGPRAILTEYAGVMTISGNAWDMCEVPSVPSSHKPPESLVAAVTNELATQFSRPQRKFLVITNMGLNLVVKRRAVDFLSASLVEADLGNQAALQDFFASFGRDQTCAMLFALASGNIFLSSESGQSATPVVANNAKGILFSQSGKPAFKEGIGYGGGDSNIVFSGRHAGFALYFARVIRPIWRTQITLGDKPSSLKSNVFEQTLVAVQKNLDSLRHFLVTNPHLFDSSQGEFTGNSRATAEQEAWKAENASAAGLKVLVSQTIEAISFVLLLQDYGLPQVAALCGDAIFRRLITLRYCDLITTKDGRDVARALVTAVINQQIAQQTSVDTISEVLQSRCGSFCSLDDAQESLRKATETSSPEERTKYLQESLRLFVDGARIMELQSLVDIVADYRRCFYATGAVFLPLRCAQEFDATNEGRDYWLMGCPPGDSDPRKQLYERRWACYGICVESLATFDEALNEALLKGQPGNNEETARTRAYQLAFESQDQAFHSFFYDWLISRGMTEELLEYRPAFLEAHLQRDPRTVEKLDFLWQYHVKTDAPLRAAKVLADMAESLDFELPLDKRIEYLTLAVNNAKSHSSAEVGRQETAVEFLTDLEEKLEVAQVQREVYHSLFAKLKNPQGQDSLRLRQLEKELLNISQLYNNYAEPYKLYVVKLLIFKVSDHRDTQLTQATWETVIAETVAEAVSEERMSHLSAAVSLLASKFFPSEAAFPLDDIALLLEKLALENRQELSPGWAPRTLTSGGVPPATVFDGFHNMYESQIPPFNTQEAIQFLSADIAILISDWLDEAIRPQSKTNRNEFPANMLDEVVNQYLRELGSERNDVRQLYESLRIRIRRHF